MVWEYHQFTVSTKGWVDIKLPDKYIVRLNQLAKKGWEVDQLVPIHTGISGTSSVVFLLKRERPSEKL
jgi:hypothetical protein